MAYFRQQMSKYPLLSLFYAKTNGKIYNTIIVSEIVFTGEREAML